MIKPAGEGLSSGFVNIKISEDHPQQFTMTVVDSCHDVYHKKESHSRLGTLFDLFLFFASLDSVSLDDMKKTGFEL